MQKIITSIKKYPFQTGIIIGVLGCILFCTLFGLFSFGNSLLDKTESLIREDYLRMSVNEYGNQKNPEAAVWRFSRLGKKANDTLKLLIKDKATPSDTLFSFAKEVGAEKVLLSETILPSVAQGGNEISMKRSISPFATALMIILGLLILGSAFVYALNMKRNNALNKNQGSRSNRRAEQPIRVADPTEFSENLSSTDIENDIDPDTLSELLASFDEDEDHQQKREFPKSIDRRSFNIDTQTATYKVAFEPSNTKESVQSDFTDYKQERDDDFSGSFRYPQERINRKKVSEEEAQPKPVDPFVNLESKLEASYEEIGISAETPKKKEPSTNKYANVNSVSPDDEANEDLLASFLRAKKEIDAAEAYEEEAEEKPIEADFSEADFSEAENSSEDTPGVFDDTDHSSKSDSEEKITDPVENEITEDSNNSPYINSNEGGDENSQYPSSQGSATTDENDEPYLVHTETTYMVGEDYFDETFSIEEGEIFLGECGIGIGETLNNNEPKAVTAIEVWLFDRKDVHTPTCYLLSEFAMDNENIRERLEQRGDTFLIQKNKPLAVSTPALYMEFTVTDLEYGTELPEKNSYFERVAIDIKVRKNE